MPRFPFASLIALALLAFPPPHADAAPIIVPVISTFDTDLDGWTPFNDPPSTTWQSAGGNPGGYVQFIDTPAASGAILAPSKFLGDWSALDGSGAILFDFHLFATGPLGSVGPNLVVISGPAGSATWTGAVPTLGSWLPNTAPLNQANWVLNLGAGLGWLDLLSDVTALSIVTEVVNSGAGGGTPETAGVDNVRLVPEPATGLLFIASLVVLGVARRRA